MKKLNIPEGYQQIMPYLIIENAGAFLQFAKNVFGATEKSITMRDEKLIMHGEVSIGESCIMFADATDQHREKNAGMYIYVDDCDSGYQKALDNGAVTIMPPADQSYGRSCGVKDPFGNTWWITGI